jgi:hypothetical protein
MRLWSLQFGLPDPGGLEKKAVWVDCGIHAREWIAPAFCQWFVKEVPMQGAQPNSGSAYKPRYTTYVHTSGGRPGLLVVDFKQKGSGFELQCS